MLADDGLLTPRRHRQRTQLRGILGEELGVEPGAAVSRLETAILRHDEELDWKPLPGASTPLSPARQAMHDEAPSTIGPSNRPTAAVVTFLFTDVVGSTEMLGRLGDEAAEELRRRHVTLLRSAVAAEGGSEVKNLGDGLMVAFDSPLAALRCAVAIQQGIDRDNREAGTQVQMRVGLHAGEPLRHEDDYFGTPVVVAKRLCDRARGSQILASALVRGLAGNRGGLAFSDQGDLVLKGLDEPVHTFEVCWTAESDETASPRGAPPAGPDQAEPAVPLSVPLPQFLTDMGWVFVGRDAEVAHLEQLWKDAASGQRRVALLAGEPGVGKTRLAAEVARWAHREGAVVLAGRCEEDLGVPYQPFVEALRHFADHIPPGHLRRCLGRYGGELGRLVPELVEQVPGLPAALHSDPETERYRLFDGVAAWLAAASAEAPLLVVLDDLQWAARPTLLLLRHVLHSAESMRLLVLGTYRDSELAHNHPLVELIASLHRQGGGQRLALSGLDDTAVAAFVEQASRRALDEEGVALAHAIYAETDGNPFFVREVLRHLSETGAVEEREEGWVTCRPIDELGIPEGVRDVVGRRLSHLSKDANRMLRVAAVMGSEFDLRVLQAADVVDEDDLLGALDEAIAARLVAEVAGAAPRYRFFHALVRDTLYAGLSGARRTTLHRRVAEAIETVHSGRLDEHLPALAHHWARAAAPAPETDRAVDYATRAGDRALAQLAHDEAAAYYRQALELLEAGARPSDDARRVELLLSLGEAQRRAGDAAFRDTLLDAARAARQRGDAGALARAALANSRSWMSSSVGAVDAGRVEALEAALAAAGDGDSPIRARLLAALGEELVYGGDRQRRVQLSDQALDIARRLRDPATLIEVLLKRFFTITLPSTLAERQRNLGELWPLAERLGDPLITSRAVILRFRTEMEAGDIEAGDRSLEEFERLTAELGQPALAWVAGLNRATRVLLSGDVGQAERLAFGNFELARATGQPDASLIFLAQLFCIRNEQGRLAELENTVQEALSAQPGVPASLHTLLAVVYCETDRLEAARPHFEAVAADDFTGIPEDNIWVLTMLYVVAACAQLQDAPRGAVLYRMLRPYADQFGFTSGGVQGGITHHLGVLAAVTGQFPQAEAHFAAAEAMHQRMGAAIWLARTRLERARMLLTRRQPGDAERAHEFLSQALASARQLGLGNVERRAGELLTSG